VLFLSGFPHAATPAARWRALASGKLAELDALMARVAQMKSILEASFRCECQQLEDCERLAAASKSSRAASDSSTAKSSEGALRRMRKAVVSNAVADRGSSSDNNSGPTSAGRRRPRG
jgi:hypothetical protein